MNNQDIPLLRNNSSTNLSHDLINKFIDQAGQSPNNFMKEFKLTPTTQRPNGILSNFSDQTGFGASHSISVPKQQTAQSLTRKTIKVLLEYSWSDQRDLIPKVKCQVAETSQHDNDDASIEAGSIYLRPLIENIRACGFLRGQNNKNITLSYFDSEEKVYVFIANLSQIDRSTLLTPDAISDSGKLILKVREIGPLSPEKMTPTKNNVQAVNVNNIVLTNQPAFSQNIRQPQDSLQLDQKRLSELSKACEEVLSLAKDNQQRLVSHQHLQHHHHHQSRGIHKQKSSSSIKDNSKRTKERQIKYVVEKVTLWRKLYNGVDIDGQIIKYSLEDAARLVNISKKSLDDYLLQLRFGRMFGFDFLGNRDENIGMLRKFVREHKEKARQQKNKTAVPSTKIELSLQPQNDTVTMSDKDLMECDEQVNTQLHNNQSKTMSCNDEIMSDDSSDMTPRASTNSNSPDTQKQ